jgi:hypothetical protein
MKTSNKILLGAFLLLIVLASAPVIIVRAKYASGNIVKEAPEEENKFKNTYRFKEPIKRVVISNLGEVLILPADTASLVIWKNGDNSVVSQTLEDGILYIKLDTAAARKLSNAEGRIYNHVELFLPQVDSINVVNSSVQIKGQLDSSVATRSYNVQLFQSSLHIEQTSRTGEATYFHQLTVNAQAGSDIHFDGKLYIGHAAFSISNTSFDDNNDVSFGKLILQADSASSINIKGQNLRNATITSKE